MKNTQKIINTLYLQDDLNPVVWTKKGDEYFLKPEIRERLLKAGTIFIDFLDADFYVYDIVLVGSLVGYNWSEFSDFDLHIIYDIGDVGKKEELYKELFKLKNTLFNSSHDIIIKGFEVEFYAQDVNEPNESAGVYSIMNNEWNEFPKRAEFKIDEKVLKEKIDQWMDIIDDVLDNAKDEDLEDGIKLVTKYRDKLRKYRTCGLQKEGEFSYENLVFKFLRRNGYIEKLHDFKNKFTDKKLSLEQEKYE